MPACLVSHAPMQPRMNDMWLSTAQWYWCGVRPSVPREATVLRIRYALSGTELCYAATSAPQDEDAARYHEALLPRFPGPRPETLDPGP
eukprot:2842799-Rhodomonas_salina.2